MRDHVDEVSSGERRPPAHSAVGKDGIDDDDVKA
jgi:hypothetical protein